jgi:hypothetical protein
MQVTHVGLPTVVQYDLRSAGGFWLENANHLAHINKTSCWCSRNEGSLGEIKAGCEIERRQVNTPRLAAFGRRWRLKVNPLSSEIEGQH